MKKSSLALIVLTALAAIAQAEPLVKQGVVFSENNYWRIGKITGNGVKVVVGMIPNDEAAKLARLNGNMVIVTGEKDETWTGNVPKFKPGFTVEEIKE